MPLLSFSRLVGALLSLLVLAATLYFLWSWWDGASQVLPDGSTVTVREPWRLWTGAAFVVWTLLGRLIVPLLISGKPHQASPDYARSNGAHVASPTGASLYVEHHGPNEAPTIILTHGWGMDSTFWSAAKRDLGDRFHLVLWDLPGLGLSKRPRDGKVAIERYAADLGHLVSLQGGGPVVLAGHSIGGMIIQTLIRDHPEASERVAGLVLLNTTYTNPLRTMLFAGLATAIQKPILEPAMYLTRWLQPLVWLSKWQSYLSGSVHLGLRFGFGRFVTRDQLEHAALLATRAPPAVEARGNQAMFRWDATNALARFDHPVMAVGGTLDIVTKLEASEVIASESPAVTLQVVEGVNHMGPLELADVYNLLIGDFTDSVLPRRADVRKSNAPVSTPAPSGADAPAA